MPVFQVHQAILPPRQFYPGNSSFWADQYPRNSDSYKQLLGQADLVSRNSVLYDFGQSAGIQGSIQQERTEHLQSWVIQVHQV